MERPIFKDVIHGYHLLTVCKALSATKTDTHYILGLASVTWYGLTSASGNGSLAKIDRVGIALLTRFALTWPERVQRVKHPTPQDVYKAMQRVEGSDVSYNRMSTMLTRDVSAGHRWLVKGSGFDGTTRRLAKHFLDYLEEGRVDEWEAMIEQERKLRNASIKSLALPDPNLILSEDEIAMNDISNRLMVNGDLDFLLSTFKLKTRDLYYYFGVSIHRWYQMYKKSDPNMAIRDPALTLLFRLYYDQPQELSLVKLPSVTIPQLMETIKDAGLNLSLEEIAHLCGFTPSIVQTWSQNTKNKTLKASPLQMRILSHFHQEVREGRYHDWHRMVIVESALRGRKPDQFWDSWGSSGE